MNFSRNPLDASWSLAKKWTIIESLLLTLQKTFPELKALRLLEQNKPLVDRDIDCSASFILAPHMTAYPTPREHRQPLRTIVIHPHGDKQTTGRVVARAFERTITRTLAQTLKESLESMGICRVYITHELGQTIDQEQAATYANRLNADLYLAITAFENKKAAPEIESFFALYDPATDFWQKKETALALLPITKTFLRNCTISYALGTELTKNLRAEADQQLFINPLYGLPLQELIGVNTPGLVIEVGIQQQEQIVHVAQVIAQATRKIIF